MRGRLTGAWLPSTARLDGDFGALPVRDGSVPVAIVSGVVSLLDDADALFAELRRTATLDGLVAITDIWSATACTFEQQPNTFWSIEAIERVAAQHGDTTLHVAVADLSTGWWSATATQVSEEIDRRHATEPAYQA